MNHAAALLMWAPVVRGQRSEWLRHDCIRATRRDARKAYREFWRPEHADQMDTAEHVRYAKVVVVLATQHDDAVAAMEAAAKRLAGS